MASGRRKAWFIGPPAFNGQKLKAVMDLYFLHAYSLALLRVLHSHLFGNVEFFIFIFFVFENVCLSENDGKKRV